MTLQRLPQPYVAGGEGSRLPLPMHWLLTEAHDLPRQSQGVVGCAEGQAGAGPSPGPRAAGCALLFALGCELGGSRYLSCLARSLKLQCCVQLAYVFDGGEMLRRSFTRCRR